MARRRKDDAGISLDSLLDTMFNVVGILVLVLVLTQLSVSGALQRLQTQVENLPEIDPEALELAEQRAQELREQVERLTEDAEVAETEMKEDRITLERLEGQIARLKELTALDPELKAERQRIEELLEQRRKEQEELTTDVADASEELQRLKALLAETPERKELPDEVVTLPNPRKAPEGYEPMHVLIANQKVYVYYRDVLEERIRKSIEAVRMMPEDEKHIGGRHREMFKRRFEVRPVKNPFFNTEPEIIGGYENIVRFEFVPREDGGETIEQMNESSSLYRRALHEAAATQRYIRFWVKMDSFRTYLRARALADQRDVPAGWELRGDNWTYHFRPRGGEYRLNQTKAFVEKVKAERAAREKEREKQPKPKQDDGPDIPPPKVDRDVGGPID